MDADIPAEKAAWRQRARQLLRTIRAEQRVSASAAAIERLRDQTPWKAASSLGAFWPRPDELDLTPLLFEWCRSGRPLAVPRFRATRDDYEFAVVRDPDRDLVAGAFALREPRSGCPAWPNKRLDLALVPGLAFDPCGRRLGRGKGFYDRLLSQITGAFCGVAFDEQVWVEIPAEPHDQRLDYILTPTRWIGCGPRAV